MKSKSQLASNPDRTVRVRLARFGLVTCVILNLPDLVQGGPIDQEKIDRCCLVEVSASRETKIAENPNYERQLYSKVAPHIARAARRQARKELAA